MLSVAQLALFALTAGLPSPTPQEEGFRPLFNGEDLSGWVSVNTAPSTWTVRDGMLICSGKPIGELRTERMYQNFILEVEWRHMRPKGNAGIFVWADDITARGQPFHRGVEIQVLENAYGNTRSHTTHGDIFPIHGAKMTPINGHGGSRAFPTENRSKPSPQWNHYRIECNDGAVSLAVNGKVVTRGKDCSPRKGYICVESEGGVVHYRNMRIKELPPTPVAPEDVAIANRGYTSLYNGVALTGWSADPGAKWRSADWVLSYGGEGQHPLSTTRSFGDYGFVFDIRLKKGVGSTRVELRGTSASAIIIDGATVGPGHWHRYEGALRGDRLTLSRNGKPLASRRLEGVSKSGPLRLVPAGPVDFANLFVR
ncbi:MAG: DUF1080 domain-containing protein [Planctomycetes bacterium]|nr:DUF1080 domain-containing protein [Planctomycetota bacterium]